jgi:uncharacterized protein (DUF488 family)
VRRKQVRHSSFAFFTVGYQSHTLHTLLGLLSANGVSVIVDVRHNPVSRKRGFSKGHLERSVSALGIRYLHFPCLGTPPRIRRFYLRTGNIQKALRQYERYLGSRKQCLRSLLSRVTSRRFCLLCLESDYNSCHRSIIAQRLTEMTGCQPTHLS